MTARAGNLLWNRVRFEPTTNVNLIDTEIIVDDQAWGADQPPLGIHIAIPPAPGDLPASRVQVIPQPPLSAWDDVLDIGEPFLDPTTNTVKVELTFPALEPELGFEPVNVLFWCPHTIQSPGQADPYGPNTPPIEPTTLDIVVFPPEGSVNVFNWGMSIPPDLGAFQMSTTPENTGPADAINVVVTLSVLIQVLPPGDDTALVSVINVNGVGWTVNPLGGNVFEITRPLAAPGVMPIIEFDVVLDPPPLATIDTRTTATVVADNAPLASTFFDATIIDPE